MVQHTSLKAPWRDSGMKYLHHRADWPPTAKRQVVIFNWFLTGQLGRDETQPAPPPPPTTPDTDRRPEDLRKVCSHLGGQTVQCFYPSKQMFKCCFAAEIRMQKGSLNSCLSQCRKRLMRAGKSIERRSSWMILTLSPEKLWPAGSFCIKQTNKVHIYFFSLRQSALWADPTGAGDIMQIYSEH